MSHLRNATLCKGMLFLYCLSSIYIGTVLHRGMQNFSYVQRSKSIQRYFIFYLWVFGTFMKYVSLKINRIFIVTYIIEIIVFCRREEAVYPNCRHCTLRIPKVYSNQMISTQLYSLTFPGHFIHYLLTYPDVSKVVQVDFPV